MKPTYGFTRNGVLIADGFATIDDCLAAVDRAAARDTDAEYGLYL